ncbi:hypothetical protein [Marinactinospora rubrisoli]|uniref:Uncharacterized protein n=1 Tax=Marinactinospora rubrisoli TaxID=2715399 RepID=A0ABW2KR63_9ACTN
MTATTETTETGPPRDTAGRDRAVAFAREHLVPPEIWGADRPCLRRQFAYAREGLWGPREGPWRRAAIAYWVAVALPVTAAAYYAAWVCERPSRLLAAAALAAAVYAAVKAL